MTTNKMLRSEFDVAAWRLRGIELAQREHALVFEVGEWYIEGQQALGRGAVRAIVEAPGWNGVQFDSIKIYASVARCYPKALRYLNVSPFHYVEAMGLARSHGLDAAMILLQQAERENRNVNWVRVESRRIRNYRELSGGDVIDDLAAAIGRKRRWRGLLIDPPLEWDGNGGKKGATETYYAHMKYEELAALKVGDVATDDAFCFLWTSATMFETQALPLLRAWGFRYKTAACWDKLTGGYGTGAYWRMENELLLLGVREKSQTHFDDPNMSSMIRFKRSMTNSEKPPVVHQMVERAIRGPYLELFGRKRVPGWDVYGNQLPAISDSEHRLAAD